MTTTTKLQDIARKARSFFKIDKRADGSEFWSFDHKTTPAWVLGMTHDAHDAGGMFPDDTRYSFIVEALDALEETEDPDDINLEADIYTHDLIAWVGSRADRYGYCDEALKEYGMDYPGFVELLQLGQAYEKAEILASVRQSLENQIEDEDEGDEPE